MKAGIDLGIGQMPPLSWSQFIGDDRPGTGGVVGCDSHGRIVIGPADKAQAEISPHPITFVKKDRQRIVGIDLGMTNSVVAVPGNRIGDGFFSIPSCPDCSVILDPQGRRKVPSIIAEDNHGQIVVGHDAKARIGLSPAPIMFARQHMGEDYVYPLDKQGSLRPEEVAAHILRHLKNMAEDRLGQTVEQAVITVPPYFRRDFRGCGAVDMTIKAGEMAGFYITQIILEPQAAAQMCFFNDPRDDLRIMTYDLGGQSFQVAILRKQDRKISASSYQAFNGDRFLGGSNFDKRVAEWLMDRLIWQKGYDFGNTRSSPDDLVLFQKLLMIGEQAKIALSTEDRYEFFEPLAGLSDRTGRPVTLEGITLARDEFLKLIWDDVERTIEICRLTLQRQDPPVDKSEIDEILMIGGSSYIPGIREKLMEEFGRWPILVEPDLCVALGAAIFAVHWKEIAGEAGYLTELDGLKFLQGDADV
jgi:molecular chaperone DnaK (HSP70)